MITILMLLTLLNTAHSETNFTVTVPPTEYSVMSIIGTIYPPYQKMEKCYGIKVSNSVDKNSKKIKALGEALCDAIEHVCASKCIPVGYEDAK